MDKAQPTAVFFNARFLTLDPSLPEVEALAVRDGRIPVSYTHLALLVVIVIADLA